MILEVGDCEYLVRHITFTHSEVVFEVHGRTMPDSHVSFCDLRFRAKRTVVRLDSTTITCRWPFPGAAPKEMEDGRMTFATFVVPGMYEQGIRVRKDGLSAVWASRAERVIKELS